jgi:hypothetical protein
MGIERTKGVQSMKVSDKNIERAKWVVLFKNFLEENGEDVGLIASNAINLPAVAENGEEYEIEITIKIPNTTEDDNYISKREQYAIKCNEKIQKGIEAKEKKERKIAADEKRRMEKQMLKVKKEE